MDVRVGKVDLVTEVYGVSIGEFANRKAAEAAARRYQNMGKIAEFRIVASE